MWNGIPDIWRHQLHLYWVSPNVHIQTQLVGFLKVSIEVSKKYVGRQIRNMVIKHHFVYINEDLELQCNCFDALLLFGCVKFWFWAVSQIMFCYRDKEATTRHDQVELLSFPTSTVDVCLDATPKRKRSSEEFMRGSFFSCGRNENQVLVHLWLLFV